MDSYRHNRHGFIFHGQSTAYAYFLFPEKFFIQTFKLNFDFGLKSRTFPVS